MKTIPISGVIGWDVYPADIRKALAEAKGDDVTLDISSNGGLVTAGLELYNVIKAYPGKITSHLVGLVASMATYVALAAPRITAERNAIFMIHNSQGGVMGDKRDMKKMCDLLEGFDGLIAAAYTAKTGKSRDEVRAMMDDESWYFGEDAKKAGFVDEMLGPEPTEDKASAHSKALALVASADEIIRKLSADEDTPAKIAALLPAGILNQSPHAEPSAQANLPAPKAESHQEVHTVNLSEFLAQGPAAVAELEAHDKKIVEPINARVAKAAAILGAEAYASDPVVRAKAIDCLKGELTPDALDGAVGMFDMMAEQRKQGEAQGEQKAQGQTPPAGGGSDAKAMEAAEIENLGSLIARGGKPKEGK